MRTHIHTYVHTYIHSYIDIFHYRDIWLKTFISDRKNATYLEQLVCCKWALPWMNERFLSFNSLTIFLTSLLLWLRGSFHPCCLWAVVGGTPWLLVTVVSAPAAAHGYKVPLLPPGTSWGLKSVIKVVSLEKLWFCENWKVVDMFKVREEFERIIRTALPAYGGFTVICGCRYKHSNFVVVWMYI